MKNIRTKTWTNIKLGILSILILPINMLQAQLVVEAGNVAPLTPENLISNFFLGDGVDVVDIEFLGDPASVGFFNNGDTYIGLERGIVMTTGFVRTQPGLDGLDMPNGEGDFGESNASTITDVDLDEISDEPIDDVATFIIKFIPTADTLRFRYVFASEEYPEFSCDQYNDIFGFFISGPGINGPYSNNAENIALVPGTNLPVAINNVHGDDPTPPDCAPINEQFYNETANGSYPRYDGYLDVFTAEAIVIPCQEYTIKLTIADVFDDVWDSGVFLEAKSFGTGSLQVEAATVSLDGTITEGCADGVLTFKLPNTAENDLAIDYTIFGSAENGVDYQFIPEDLIILAGQDSVSVPVIAFEDNIPEGIDTIGIDVQRDPCNRDTFYFFIRDNELVPPNLGPDLSICLSDSVQLDGTLPIVIPEPVPFTNTTEMSIVTIPDNNPPPPGTVEPTMSNIQVFGVQPTTLGPGVIKSVCLNIDHNWVDEVDIFLVSPGGQFLELTTDNGGDGNDYINTCFTPDATDPIDFGNPFGAPNTATPFTGNFAPEGVWEDLWDGENPTNGIWQLLLKDDQTDLNGKILDWSICFEPLYEIFYEWTPAVGLSCTDCPNPIAKPDVTTTYFLTAFDTYGCEVYDTITINVSDRLDAPDVQCGIITNNSITFDWAPVSGATGYEVNVDGMGWIPASPGPLSHFVAGLGLNDTVRIEVRGIGSCEGSIGMGECNTPNCSPAMSSIDLLSNVSCYGGSDGVVNASAAGINPPFSFTLNGVTNQTGIFSGLEAGNYTLEITDGLNCTGSTPITITQPDSLIASEVILQNVSCNGGNDGSATLSITGGTGPYAFTWDNGEMDSIAVALNNGVHTLDILDAQMCLSSHTVSITEPTALALVSSADTVCFQANNGTATVTPSGGTPPYSYLWDANANGQTDSTAIDLGSGNYTVTVTDALMCSEQITITVEENPEITLMTSSTQASCSGINDATATVTPSGGTGPYTYLWDDDKAQTTATADSLTVNTYNVIVTDQKGCTQSTQVMVSSPNSIMVDVQTVPTKCSNSTDGEATVMVQGGVSPYTYEWSDNGIVLNNGDRTDLAAGMHQLIVRDVNMCFETVNVFIDSAMAITYTTDSTLVDCFGNSTGTATVIAAGGAGGFSYEWDINANSQMTSTATGLSEGLYEVTITDSELCTQVASVQVNEPTAIALTTDSTLVDCFGSNTGTATVSATGGTGDYTYLWDANANNQITATASSLIAGSYMVTVRDVNMCPATTTLIVNEPTLLGSTTSVGTASCDGLPDGTATVTPNGGTAPYTYLWSDPMNQVTQTASSLVADEYYVTVTDNNNCMTFDTVDIAAPPPLSVNFVTITDVDCNGNSTGSIDILAGGGSAPYEYLWSNGMVTEDLQSVPAGTYSVIVTDANQCSVTSSVDTIHQPDALVLDTAKVNLLCFGDTNGSIDLTVTGGTAPYTYNWNNGTLPANEDLANLPGGVYTVVVRDANLCSANVSVTIEEPTAIDLSFTSDDVRCYLGNDGAINLSVSGGTPNYDYDWSGPNSFTNNNEDLVDIEAGTYKVLVNDDNGCTDSITLDIIQPTEGVNTSVSLPDTICNGATNGQATVSATGGTAPYSYAWPDGQDTPTVTNLSGGIHEVIVTDNENCSFVDTAYINEAAAVTLILSQQSASCHDANDGTATLEEVQFGLDGIQIPTSTIQWNTGQSGNTITGLQGGQTYTIVASDEFGCTSTNSITIDNPDEIGAIIENVTNVSCNNGNDGTATANGVGGTAPYSFVWDNNAGSQVNATATGLSPGQYEVTVMDASSCMNTTIVEITEPAVLSLELTSENVKCFNGNDGSITSQIVGGVPPYSYNWSNGSIDPNQTNISAGNYDVMVMDAQGCSTSASVFIAQPDFPVVGTVDTRDVICNGDRDGLIEVFPEGGIPPYQYSFNGIDYNSNATYIGLSAGDYPEIYIRDNNGCEFIIENTRINEPAAVEVDLGEDIQINLSDLYTFNPRVSNAVGIPSYQWITSDTSISCIDCLNPTIDIKFGYNYRLIVTDENGCVGEASVDVRVNKEKEIFVPTAFTPNGDGINDFLVVHGKSRLVDTVKVFKVFDRWGELVYEATDFKLNDPTVFWNGNFKGKTLNPGVFVWYVEASFIDGTDSQFTGNTTLLK